MPPQLSQCPSSTRSAVKADIVKADIQVAADYDILSYILSRPLVPEPNPIVCESRHPTRCRLRRFVIYSLQAIEYLECSDPSPAQAPAPALSSRPPLDTTAFTPPRLTPVANKTREMDNTKIKTECPLVVCTATPRLAPEAATDAVEAAGQLASAPRQPAISAGAMISTVDPPQVNDDPNPAQNPSPTGSTSGQANAEPSEGPSSGASEESNVNLPAAASQAQGNDTTVVLLLRGDGCPLCGAANGSRAHMLVHHKRLFPQIDTVIRMIGSESEIAVITITKKAGTRYVICPYCFNPVGRLGPHITSRHIGDMTKEPCALQRLIAEEAMTL